MEFYYRRSNDGRRYSVYVRGGAVEAIGYVLQRGAKWVATDQFGRDVSQPCRHRDKAAVALTEQR